VAPDGQRSRCTAKSAHPGAKAALAEIYNAQDRKHAEVAAKAFAIDYGPKWPKAVAKITDELDTLLAFYDYPAEHWIHLRTQTRSSRPSPLFGSASASPKAPAPGLPGSRWPSSSWSPLRPAGAP